MSKPLKHEITVCPFCGKSKNSIIFYHGMSDRMPNKRQTYYHVRCYIRRCGTRGPERTTQKAAVKAWNKNFRPHQLKDIK